jgi:hypothetical protein
MGPILDLVACFECYLRTKQPMVISRRENFALLAGAYSNFFWIGCDTE